MFSTFVLKYKYPLVFAFGLLVLACLAVGIITEQFAVFAVPVVIAVGALAIIDWKKIYYLFIFSIPLSITLNVGGGFSTDLPTEPIMVFFMLVLFAYSLVNYKKFDLDFFRHPIIQLLLLHVLWIVVSVIFTQIFKISIKYLLAKIWYISTFVFITSLVVKNITEFKKIFWLLVISMGIVASIALVRHAGYGFAFDKVNSTVQPFFLNHVDYAAMLSILLPYMVFSRTLYKKFSYRRTFINALIILYLAAIYFSYTRGAWVGVIVGFVAFFIFKKGMVKWALGASAILLVAGLVYLSQDNRYLKLAPDYKKTIYHNELGDHLESTLKLQDLSSAERMYRWIAGIRMSGVHPVTGFGPGNFYSFYKRYTVTLFTTWVSDNPEKSTAHNYLLTVLIEQGFIGFVIFLAFTAGLFIYGQRVYERAIGHEKLLAITILVSLVIIYCQLMLSDMVEIDTVGGMYFIGIAMLVGIDVRRKRGLKKLRAES